MKYIIKKLIEELNKATKAYDMGTPIMSDKEWDDKYFKLQELELSSGIIYPNSPTQTINYEVVNQLNKREHNHPMLSLDKTKDWSEFIKYFENHDVVGMLKMDGLTCSLKYLNGKLVQAETRGNGRVGEDILHNAKVVQNIPLAISYTEEIIIDGEIICTFSDFEPFKNEYANPRNFAAGSIRLLDSNESKNRHLKFVAWNLIKGGSNNFINNLTLMDNLGFTVVPWTSSFDWDAKDFLIDRAKEEGYPIDGLVGRFNDIEYGESLGSTDHHSRAAYAFKFDDETAETVLENIEWSIGRTGILTPVAIFKPIELEGSTVERASLHNITVMKELLGDTPHIGQSLTIMKSNMIIPQVKKADKTLHCTIQDLLLDIPEKCPVCGGRTKLETQNESTFLLCDNLNCEGKLINRLDNFCGKKGLDIKGISKATLEKLVDWNWVQDLESIFTLKDFRELWIKKPGFGEKSVDKILTAIENSRNCDLHQFICSLGIPLVGIVAAKELQDHFGSWNNFIDAVEDKYSFYNLPNFGPELHNSIINFNYKEAKYIAENYLKFNAKEVYENNEEQKLSNKIFVITGKLIDFKNREELKQLIEQHGGKVTGSVSKNTNYLINNDKNSTSAKNKTALNLGIEIITEKDFLKFFD